MTFTLEAAGQVEETYDDLAVRGRKLVERIRKQRATQDLLAQGRGNDTSAAARSLVTVAKRVGDDLLANS